MKSGCPQRAVNCFLGKFRHPRISKHPAENRDWESIKPNLVLCLANVEKLYYLKILSSTGMESRLNLGIMIDIRNFKFL